MRTSNPLNRQASRIVLFSLAAAVQQAGAATYISTGSGSFNSAIWTPAIPGTNTTGGPEVGSGLDDATIQAGHTVTYTNNFFTGGASATDFTVAGGSTLTVDGGTIQKTGGGNWTKIGDPAGGGNTGTVIVQNGGTWQDDGNEHLVIGGDNGATGIFRIVGPGSSLQYNVNNSKAVYLGFQNGATGIMDVDGGTLNIAPGGNNREIVVGFQNGSTGTLNVTNGGTVNSASDDFRIGQNNGATGTVTVDATSTLNHTASGRHMQIGQDGTGTLTVDGAANSSAQVNLGNGGTGVGTFNLGATGTFDQNNQSFRVGNSGTGTYNLAGTHNQNVDSFFVGTNGGSNGTVNVTGTLDVSDSGGFSKEIIVGNSGTGVMNINAGGTVNSFDDDFRIGQNGGSNGTVNVNAGGTLNHAPVGGNRFFQIAQNGGTGTLNIAGGTFNSDDTVQLADSATGNATMNVSGGAFTQTGGDLRFDMGTTTFTQTGGSVTLNSNLLLGNGGSDVVDLTGGNFIVPGNVDDRPGFTDFLIGGTSVFSANNVLFDDAGDSPMDDIFTVVGSNQSVNIANNLTINNDDVFKFVFDATGFNPITVGNNVNLSGATGMFDFTNYSTPLPFMTEIPLIDIASGGSNGSGGIFDNFGELDFVGAGGPNGYLLSRIGGDGNDLVLLRVPEPSRAVLLLAGIAGMLLRRRR